jgi:ABC-type multidrug transport system fused ATPase/permease subunit
LQENVTGYKVVRSFTREEYEKQKFRKTNDEYFEKTMKVVKLSATFSPASDLISSGGAVLLIFIGAILVLNGWINLGEVVSFYVYYSFLYDPIKFVVQFFSQFSEIMAAADRISDLLSGKRDIVEKPPAKEQSLEKRIAALENNFLELVTPEARQLLHSVEERVRRLRDFYPTVHLTTDMNHEAVVSAIEKASRVRKYSIRVDPKSFTGEVEFRNVSFTYKDSKRPVLKQVNFKVKPGEIIAFLGSTGSGKSTIINLIPRFYDVTEGEILVDGVDLRDYELKSYRRQVGIVAQETFLFSRSIKDNIAYGRKGVKRRDIMEVAKIANIHDFIMTLPKKYKTIVGERGVTLSGGQKQRIAIARALLIRPKILILDDSTSSVDVDTEYEIQKALRKLFKETTTFIITQRISTVRDATRIFIIDDGEIVEQGTHEELLAKRGIYTRIYNTLFRTQSHKTPMKLVIEDDKMAIRPDYEYGDRVGIGPVKKTQKDSPRPNAEKDQKKEAPSDG